MRSMKDGTMSRDDWDTKVKAWEEHNPKINETIMVSLEMYVTSRVRPGSFMIAMLENDLVGALLHAHPGMFDRHRGALSLAPDETDAMIKTVIRFMSAVLPRESWGDPVIVAAWLNGDGRAG